MSPKEARVRAAARGFTLLELLVVVVIIGEAGCEQRKPQEPGRFQYVDEKIGCFFGAGKATAARDLRSSLFDFFELVSQICPTETEKPALVAGFTG